MLPVGREAARQRAATQLRGPEYQHEPLVDEIWRGVRQFLGDLTNPEGTGGALSGFVSAALIALVLGGLAALLLWRLRGVTRRVARAEDELFGPRTLSAAEHRRGAVRLAAEARWAEAVRERLRAIARELEERALVDAAPGRTADELAAEAGRALPGLADELAEAARLFDDVTYGDAPGSSQGYAAISALDERLRRARPAPATAAGRHP